MSSKVPYDIPDGAAFCANVAIPRSTPSASAEPGAAVAISRSNTPSYALQSPTETSCWRDQGWLGRDYRIERRSSAGMAFVYRAVEIR